MNKFERALCACLCVFQSATLCCRAGQLVMCRNYLQENHGANCNICKHVQNIHVFGFRFAALSPGVKVSNQAGMGSFWTIAIMIIFEGILTMFVDVRWRSMMFGILNSRTISDIQVVWLNAPCLMWWFLAALTLVRGVWRCFFSNIPRRLNNMDINGPYLTIRVCDFCGSHPGWGGLTAFQESTTWETVPCSEDTGWIYSKIKLWKYIEILQRRRATLTRKNADMARHGQNKARCGWGTGHVLSGSSPSRTCRVEWTFLDATQQLWIKCSAKICQVAPWAMGHDANSACGVMSSGDWRTFPSELFAADSEQSRQQTNIGMILDIGLPTELNEFIVSLSVFL